MSLKLSCKSEYAILALVELAANYASGDPLQMQHLAAQQHIPDRYLEQLLATLKRFKLVRSQRGAHGGYRLAREPWKITVLDVIKAIEGEHLRKAEDCSSTQDNASGVVQEVWGEAGQAADSILESYTLQDLVEKWNEKRQQSDNIMYYI